MEHLAGRISAIGPMGRLQPGVVRILLAQLGGGAPDLQVADAVGAVDTLAQTMCCRHGIQHGLDLLIRFKGELRQSPAEAQSPAKESLAHVVQTVSCAESRLVKTQSSRVLKGAL